MLREVDEKVFSSVPPLCCSCVVLYFFHNTFLIFFLFCIGFFVKTHYFQIDTTQQWVRQCVYFQPGSFIMLFI